MDNSSGNWDVLMQDLAKGETSPIFRGPGQQMYPVISGDLVVWQDDRNGNWDVYVRDLASGSETKLTADGDQVYPDVSGNTISWEDGKTKDISYYIWDKKWGKTYPRPGEQTSPVVSDKYIAYVDGTGENTSIRKLDISNWKDDLVQVGPGQVKPSMDEKLVWLNAHTGRPRSVPVMSGQTSVICKAPGDQSHPVVGGNDQVGYYVAWTDNRTGNPDIYVYSLAQEIELPIAASPYEDMNPDISGSILAWVARNPENQYHIEDYWSIRTFAKAVVEPCRAFSRHEQPSLDRIADRYSLLRQVVQKPIPAVRRVPKFITFDRLGSNSTIGQIVLRLCGPPQSAFEERAGYVVGANDTLPLRILPLGLVGALDCDSDLLCKLLDGLRECQVVDLLHKFEDIAAFAAAIAFPELMLLVNGERPRSLLVVKRARP